MILRTLNVIANVVTTFVVGLLLGPTLVLFNAVWLAGSWFFFRELLLHERIGFSVDPVFVKRALLLILAYALLICYRNLIVVATEKDRTPRFSLTTFEWRAFRQSVIALLLVVTLEPYLQEIENN